MNTSSDNPGPTDQQDAAEDPANRPSQAQASPGKILVTGSSGFVGRHVINELVHQGYQTICLLRDPRKLTDQVPSEVSAHVVAVQGDLFDTNALAEAARGCRAAIHLVGIIEENRSKGQTFGRIHVAGTQQIINACVEAGIHRYVHMSALGTRPEAVSRYHQTKWLAEEIVRQSPLQWTIFRPSLVYGPDSEFIQMVKYIVTSRVVPAIPYFGTGTHRLQPISVYDVATCFAKCLKMPETYCMTYELGGPEQLTWKELYDACALAIRGRPKLTLPIPVPIATIAARVLVPLIPSAIMPYKFNVAQIQMSQEDNVCDSTLVERTFSIQLRNFRDELLRDANQIK